MKRFFRMLVETKDFRKDVLIFATVTAIIGLVYPWIARGAGMIIPFIVQYYAWVAAL